MDQLVRPDFKELQVLLEKQARLEQRDFKGQLVHKELRDPME